MDERTMRYDLCKECWETMHPGQYAPIMDRDGYCTHCGDGPVLVTRTTFPPEETAE